MTKNNVMAGSGARTVAIAYSFYCYAQKRKEGGGGGGGKAMGVPKSSGSSIGRAEY